MFTVEYDPEGFACNMRFVVRNGNGAELYRGPEWACHYRASAWNAGRETMEDRNYRQQLEGVGAILETLRGVVQKNAQD